MMQVFKGTEAFIGLGSNLGEPLKQIDLALAKLDEHDDIDLLALSPVYESIPHGEIAQANFINAVLQVRTRLAPEDLLSFMLAVESDMGRVRVEKWGPRRIDLDLILYADIRIDSESLTLPHPYLFKREFVLKPLFDLVSELDVSIAFPVDFFNGDWQSLLSQLPIDSLQRVRDGKNYN